MTKPRRVGIQMGIVSLAFGVVFLVANAVLFASGKLFPVMLALTPPLILAAVAFFAMPGSEPPPEVPANLRVKAWWKDSPPACKLAWIAAMAIGLCGGLWLMFSYTKFA